ncbi:efflux transporter outer membrane subunit [uncultured Algimonas sp.]|uniref:efflux transporter outer membrane subunit n=1 Tax=uncultured Algimonas sp. TaxID=1547920 RepID=UPI002608D10E|nr:efflux transporter outer membrane subunit [uncultured Algimonas sp.]
MTRLIQGVALGAMLLSGCSTLHNGASETLATDAAAQAGWTDRTIATAAPAASAPLDDVAFWAGFDDPLLVALLDEVIANNPAVDEAQARLREARAVIGVIGSRSRIQLSATPNAGRERLSAEGPGPQGQIPGVDLEQSFFSLGGVAAWEPDIWSRNALSVEAGEARAEAMEALADAVQLGLKADTGRTYIRLRAAEADLVAIDQTLAALRDTEDLTRQLVEVGLSAEFDLLQVGARIEGVEAERLQVTGQVTLLRYALATLLGHAPAEMEGRLPAGASIPDYDTGIPAGLPSTLIYRRPDVAAARLQLLAAAKNEENVSLNHLPNFSLTGDGGLLSTGLDALFDADSRRGLISAALNWPILSGGRLSAERDIADAQTAAAQAVYDQALLRSLNDVETAFERYATSGETLVRIDNLIERQTRIRRLAEARYLEGEDSQFRSLEAETELLSAERRKAELLAARSVAAVDIYAALGGGF